MRLSIIWWRFCFWTILCIVVACVGMLTFWHEPFAIYARRRLSSFSDDLWSNTCWWLVFLIMCGWCGALRYLCSLMPPRSPAAKTDTIKQWRKKATVFPHAKRLDTLVADCEIFGYENLCRYRFFWWWRQVSIVLEETESWIFFLHVIYFSFVLCFYFFCACVLLLRILCVICR